MAVADGAPEDVGGGSPGVWGSWGPWSACSRSCSGGVMEQTRPCLPSSYRARGGPRPSGPTLSITGHVVSAVRTSVPLHRSREEQHALAGSSASRPGPTVVRGSRHPQARGREPSERRYVCTVVLCLSLPEQQSCCPDSVGWECLPPPLCTSVHGCAERACGSQWRPQDSIWLNFQAKPNLFVVGFCF